MESEKPCLSIIIVSYNTKEITKNCLQSIYQASWKDPFEIIVVDNNSQDGTIDMIKEEFPKVKLIENYDNKFFAKANNQGAKIARGKYLLLLNSDTLVYDDNLQKMIDFYEKQKSNIICIGPKILNKDKSIQSYGVHKYGFIHHVLISLKLHKLPGINLVFKSLPSSPKKTHEVGWVSGCCMMIPKNLYEKVGGLNENLEFYGEEPEFSYRTQKLGYKTLFYHKSEIIHLGGISSKSIPTFQEKFTYYKRYDKLIKETHGYKNELRNLKFTSLCITLKMILYPKKKNNYLNNKKEIQNLINFVNNRISGMSLEKAINIISHENSILLSYRN